jgi:tRNA(Ile)-lysidine synthase
VRHELFPILEGYNPKIKEVILRMAGVMGSELEVIEAALDRHWDAVLVEVDKSSLGFERFAWDQLPNGVRRGLLLRALRFLFSEWTNIDFATIYRALIFLSTPAHNGRIFLQNGLQIVRRSDRIWILAGGAKVPGETWPAMLADTTEEILDVPGEIVLRNGWRFTVETLEVPFEGWAGVVADPDEFQAWIDGTQFPGPFTIRSRLPGERFRPLGLEGQSQKISDLMINVKLPVEARTSWPLVDYEGEVLWVPGIRLAHRARLKPDTRVINRLRLRPGQP